MSAFKPICFYYSSGCCTFNLISRVRLRKRLKKLWCFFRWYVYTPYWHWIYLPIFARYRLIRKPVRRWKRAAIAGFWRFVAAVERSPEVMKALSTKTYNRIKAWFLSFRIVVSFLRLVRAFLKVYFKIINFRRLLIGYMLADFFYYRWSDEGIDKDLRIWNICMLVIFFKVLYMLMDGADKALTMDSQDLVTRLYLRRYLEVQPEAKLTADQMNDKYLAKYIRFRHRRNIYLAIFGFLYTGQPLFRVYK